MSFGTSLRAARIHRLAPRPPLSRSLASSPANVPQPPAPLAPQQPSSASPPDLQQSPNNPTTWSTQQQPKPAAYANARFEQTKLEFQPNSLSGMGMVAKDPIRLVNGRKAVCDGGESM